MILRMELRKPIRMIMIYSIRALLKTLFQVMNGEYAEYCHTRLISNVKWDKSFHYRKIYLELESLEEVVFSTVSNAVYRAVSTKPDLY